MYIIIYNTCDDCDDCGDCGDGRWERSLRLVSRSALELQGMD